MSCNEGTVLALRESEDPELSACSQVKCGQTPPTTAGSIMLQFDTHRASVLAAQQAEGTGAVTAILRALLRPRSDVDRHRGGRMKILPVGPYATPFGLPPKHHVNQQGHGGMDFVMMYRLIRCRPSGAGFECG